MNLKDDIVAPLISLWRNVYRSTGTRPTIEVYVHSSVYDQLCDEVLEYGSTRPRDGDDREGMWFEGDIVIRPERTRPREPITRGDTR